MQDILRMGNKSWFSLTRKWYIPVHIKLYICIASVDMAGYLERAWLTFSHQQSSGGTS